MDEEKWHPITEVDHICRCNWRALLQCASIQASLTQRMLVMVFIYKFCIDISFFRCSKLLLTLVFDHDWSIFNKFGDMVETHADEFS